jgi:acyl-CoA thioesterase-1
MPDFARVGSAGVHIIGFAASFRRSSGVRAATVLGAICLSLAMAASGQVLPSPINIVAIGGSNTAGWGVGSQNAYPAQLQAMLKAKGYNAHVTGAGVSFQTTSGMLQRIDSAVPAGTSIVILQPGGNDLRFFGSKKRRAANIAAMVRRMHARNIKAIVFDNAIVPRGYFQWDGIHFTIKGHALVASRLMQDVTAPVTPPETKAQAPQTSVTTGAQQE